MLIIGCCRLHTLTIKYDTETRGATDYKFGLAVLELNNAINRRWLKKICKSLSTPSRYNLPPTGSNVEILNIIILIVNYILAFSTEQTSIKFTSKCQSFVSKVTLFWYKIRLEFCNLCQVVTLWFTDQKYFQIQVRCCWRVKLQCVASTRGHSVLETSMINFILVNYIWKFPHFHLQVFIQYFEYFLASEVVVWPSVVLV